MSEVRLPAPVKATPVPNAFDCGKFGDGTPTPGAFSFDEAPSDAAFWGHIKFTCPCGCGVFHRLPIGLNSKPPTGADPNGIKATWQWDGNRETPTLTPSIHHVDHWHGFLTAGFFTQA